MKQTPEALSNLGWSGFFADQIAPEESSFKPMRIATIHRSRLTAVGAGAEVKLVLPASFSTADFAVGDWVLTTAQTHLVVRRLDRMTVFQRRTVGARCPQIIAANIETLLIVTSCNADFNTARLERYLALSNEAGTTPVIVLTKADKIPDASDFQRRAAALQRGLAAVALNAKDPNCVAMLKSWAGPGQTVALVGSSGVGKSTLLNTLCGLEDAEAQRTGDIRENDARGRHTTTSRSLHPIQTGGWVIDTPGMRTVQISNLDAGIDQVFAEICDLTPQCHFNDCTHVHEPGCAVMAGVAAGAIDPTRLDRWRKLQTENADNTSLQTGPRGNRKTQNRPHKR